MYLMSMNIKQGNFLAVNVSRYKNRNFKNLLSAFLDKVFVEIAN